MDKKEEFEKYNENTNEISKEEIKFNDNYLNNEINSNENVVTTVTEEALKNLEKNIQSNSVNQDSEEEKDVEVESNTEAETKEEPEIESKVENKIEDNDETKAEIENKEQNEVSEKLIKKPSKKSHKRLIIISIIIAVLILLSSTVFALLNLHNDKIISGVCIKGIDVSGLTKDEAYEKVLEVISSKLSTPFDLIHGESVTTVVPEQFDANFDITSSVNTAYERGRGKNIFVNNFEILSSHFFKINIIPSFSYNEETIDALVTEIEANLPDKLVQPTYYIDGSNLIINRGSNGVTINSEALKLKIISNINNFYSSNANLEIPTIDSTANDINIEKIHEEIYKEAKDAYYTKNPFVVYPHIDGIDFSISMDEAKAMLQEEKDSYTITLKITTPTVTTNQIGTEAFPDLLATYSTKYSTSNVNRSTNISLATSKINGTVIMPGETFSYNTTVGKRTASAGFKSAAVYSGGKVTSGIGGGICQVSSTLYNSVLLSNLGIVERQNHGFNTGYVPAGRDATVSWGGPDFKFKNTRNYPIKLVCTASKGRITTQIFGLKEENEYEVEIQSYITSYIKYKTITYNDPTLPAGTTKVVANGSNGCRSVCYRILKQNGEVISKTLLSQDTYNPHNKEVAVGTKQ